MYNFRNLVYFLTYVVCFSSLLYRWFIWKTFGMDQPGTDGYRGWIYCFNFISKRFTYGEIFMSWNWFSHFTLSDVLTLWLIVLQITFFFGTILNEIFNKILKNWIQEPRPVERANLTDQYGMPSSHSQFIWFFSIYATLFILFRFDTIFRAIFISIFVIPVIKKKNCWQSAFFSLNQKNYVKTVLDCHVVTRHERTFNINSLILNKMKHNRFCFWDSISVRDFYYLYRR